MSLCGDGRCKMVAFITVVVAFVVVVNVRGWKG